MVQIFNFERVFSKVAPSFDPGLDPWARGLVVDSVAVDPVCNVSLFCDPIDPETVFEPLLVDRSTAKISGVKLPRMRLLLATRYPS